MRNPFSEALNNRRTETLSQRSFPGHRQGLALVLMNFGSIGVENVGECLLPSEDTASHPVKGLTCCSIISFILAHRSRELCCGCFPPFYPSGEGGQR